MSHPVAGELFAQRFLVEARIATGGMSAIFRAIDQRTGRSVALKLLQSHGSAEAIQRFARETQILAELHHPHIVSYVAHGVDATTQPYLAMDWLEGENLAERMRRGPLGLRDTVADRATLVARTGSAADERLATTARVRRQPTRSGSCKAGTSAARPWLRRELEEER
jgi:hypothetical protein